MNKKNLKKRCAVVAGLLGYLIVPAHAEDKHKEEAPKGKAIITIFSDVHSGFGHVNDDRGFNLDRAYLEFDDIKDRYYDAFLMTGAPVETIPFESVDYWKEIEAYLDWAEYHCYSTMTLCWGAQAALYHYYGVNKTILPAKMFGIFPYGLTVKNHPLLRGFDDRYFIPQSRHTAVDDDAIDACKALQVLSRSVENGINICATKDLRRIFVLGHFEYDRYTLANEYFRDKKKNLPIDLPEFYFPDGDTTQVPVFKWRSYAHLFYMNWLNIVYQDTPYDLHELAPASGNKLDKAIGEYNKILLQLQRMGAAIPANQ